jgi:hypothetical protein
VGCEISTGINNEIMQHLPDVTRCLIVRQTEQKEGFQRNFKKMEVVDVVVLSSSKTERAGSTTVHTVMLGGGSNEAARDTGVGHLLGAGTGCWDRTLGQNA